MRSTAPVEPEPAKITACSSEPPTHSRISRRAAGTLEGWAGKSSREARASQRTPCFYRSCGPMAGRRAATYCLHVADDCVFCGIVGGDIEAEIVLDEDDLVAFLDQRPVFKGHTLLVPREHVVTLPDLPPTQRDAFLHAAQRLATAVVDGLGAQGSFVAVNNVVSQSVPHLHLHVVPRAKGDGLRGFFWPRTKYADAAERGQYAERLRAVLG